MSAASYYDKATTQDESSGHQAGPMHSDMQQRGFPQQGYNGQSENGIYNGQEPRMGNSNYTQGAQQMNDHNNSNYAQGAQQAEGAQGATADNRDTMTKCNDNPPDYKEKERRTTSLMNEYPLQCSEMHFCYRPPQYPCLLSNLLLCVHISA